MNPSSRSAPRTSCHERSDSDGSHLSELRRLWDPVRSRVDFECEKEGMCDWKRLAEGPNLESCQSLNATLLNLLDKQKRMHHHLERCLEDVKDEKREKLLQKEVEVQNIKMELGALKSKCHQLQSTSPYAMQFDAYENETRLQLHQIQNLKELNASLTAQLTEREVLHKDEKLQKQPVNQKPSASMKKLEKEIASLKKENLELQSKARCYDFFKKQCALLMTEVRSLKSARRRD